MEKMELFKIVKSAIINCHYQVSPAPVRAGEDYVSITESVDGKKRITACRIMIGCSRELAEEIKTLENELQGEHGNGEIQKALMLKYNRALSVYAKSKIHRQDIDALFIRIDELRNIIRRNI